MKLIPKNKITKDLIYTKLSFGSLVVSGLLSNFLISYFFGNEELGIYNLNLSLYLVLSQITVFGLHFSILKTIPAIKHEKSRISLEVSSNVSLSLAISIVVTLLLMQFAPLFGRMFGNEELVPLLRISSIGLIFFSFNKIMMHFMQGMRKILLFSSIQTVKYVLFFIGNAYVCYFDRPITHFGFVILLSEAAVTILSILWYLIQGYSFKIPVSSLLHKHYKFGKASFAGGIFGDLNAKINILLLGVFFEEDIVGVFSFSFMIGYGLYQLIINVRTNFNPILVEMFSNSDHIGIKKLLIKTSKIIYPATILFSTLIVGVFYIITGIYYVELNLLQGLGPLVIILLGIIIISPMIPFDNTFIVSGKPFYQTLQMLFAFSINLLGCVIFIPLLGMIGASIAFSLSTVMSVLFLNYYSKKLLNLSFF